MSYVSLVGVLNNTNTTVPIPSYLAFAFAFASFCLAFVLY
jgi:hypothetical protein